MNTLPVSPGMASAIEEAAGRRAYVTEKPSTSFTDMLDQSIGEVNRLHDKADLAVERLTTGEHADIHGTMIAMKKAEVSFQLMMQVRNKVVEAYQEVNRMAI
ncbi:MAG: flagellar hook-basal body complex protein FliE [Desulfobacterales bacterium]|nr:flagellar hook-basal body complex protein FliE [Desulfobacterales bacterium]